MKALKMPNFSFGMNPRRSKRHGRLLGLALAERSIQVAEVVAVTTAGTGAAAGSGRYEAKRLAEFEFPAEMSLQQPEQLGAALGQFLRQQNFSARAAVVGIPARWLVVKAKEVPPSDDATATSVLRLQAESEFSPELKDLVYDYAGRASADAAQTVLLMATPRRNLEQIQALAEAAKLEVVAVTPSSAALGAATARAAGADARHAMVLSVAPGGAELSAGWDTSAPSTLRTLRGPQPEAAFLSELRRAVSLVPRQSLANGSTKLICWDGAGLEPTALAAVGASLGVTVQTKELAALGVSIAGLALGANGDGNGSPRRFAAAVALAVAAMSGGSAAANTGLPVDFLHSRLAPPKQRPIDSRIVYGGIAAVVLVALATWAYVDLGRKSRALDALVANQNARQPLIKAAEASVAKIEYARKWHGGDPKYLACLRDLTTCIPDNGKTYVSNLTLREYDKETNAPLATAADKAAAAAGTVKLRGTLAGKSSDDVLPIMEAMKASGRFIEVKQSWDIKQAADARDARRSGREAAFQMTFVYLPPPPVPGTPLGTGTGSDRKTRSSRNRSDQR